MNLKNLYENRGVRFYYNMSSLDFVKAITAVPYLYNRYKDGPQLVQNVSDAKAAREQAEKDLENAEATLKYEQDRAISYHVVLNTDVDAYLKVIQEPGSFMGDGGPLPTPITPMTVLNNAYGVIESGKDVSNLNNQIEKVIPDAEKVVEEKKAALEAAIQNEMDTVNKSINEIISIII